MASEADTVKKDVEELRAALQKLTHDVAAIGQSLSRDVKAQASQAASDLGDKGRQSAEAVGNTIRERPFQSLFVAFGAGMMLAQLLRSR